MGQLINTFPYSGYNTTCVKGFVSFKLFLSPNIIINMTDLVRTSPVRLAAADVGLGTKLPECLAAIPPRSLYGVQVVTRTMLLVPREIQHVLFSRCVRIICAHTSKVDIWYDWIGAGSVLQHVVVCFCLYYIFLAANSRQ